MRAYKRIVKTVAKNYKVDPDEILIYLWDFPSKSNNFNYLKNENSVIKKSDIRFVKDVVIPEIKGDKDRDIPVVEREKKVNKIHKDFSFNIGSFMRNEKYLNKSDIMRIYERLIIDLEMSDDPIHPMGVRDEDLLEMAIFHPQTSFSRVFKYPTIQSASAALMYAISNNHAFINGNKRTSIVAMLVFLDMHNYNITCEESELFRIAMNLAKHNLVEGSYYNEEDAEIYELTLWINKNSKEISKGERPLPLRKLKKILDRFDCDFKENGKIERSIIVKNILGFNRPKKYSTKKVLSPTLLDGFEVNKNLIRSIRQDLGLTSKNGIDSDVFYNDADFTTSEFINQYKGLLRRLSKT